jgi:hypothetical protein
MYATLISLSKNKEGKLFAKIIYGGSESPEPYWIETNINHLLSQDTWVNVDGSKVTEDQIQQAIDKLK